MSRGRVAALLVGMTLAACAERPGKDPGSTVTVRVDALTSAGAVTTVTVDVTPDAIHVSLTKAADGSYGGTIVVPVGPHTFTATAWVGAQLVGTGSAAVTVTGGSAIVNIAILDTTQAAPVPDHGPVILSLTASSASVYQGDPVHLAANAVDIDGDAIAYQWTSDCAGSAFTAPTARTTDWSATAAGTCNLTLSVASSHAGGPTLTESRSVRITVNPAVNGRIDVSATYVPWPEIYELDVGACQVSRTAPGGVCRAPIAPGTPVTVSVFFTAAGTVPSTASLSDGAGGTPTLLDVNPVSGVPGAYVARFTWTTPSSENVYALTANVMSATLTDTFAVGVLVSNGPGAPPASTTPAIQTFAATPPTIAPGSSTVLSATYTDGVGIVSPGAQFLPSGGTIVVAPTSTTTYTLTVTDGGGHTATAATTVVVALPAPPPSIRSLVVDRSLVAAGQTLQFTASFVGASSAGLSCAGGRLTASLADGIPQAVILPPPSILPIGPASCSLTVGGVTASYPALFMVAPTLDPVVSLACAGGAAWSCTVTFDNATQTLFIRPDGSNVALPLNRPFGGTVVVNGTVAPGHTYSVTVLAINDAIGASRSASFAFTVP